MKCQKLIHTLVLFSLSLTMFECKHPGCSYTDKSKYNFDRHQSVHTGIKVICECGQVLSPAALDRHKKNSCTLTIRSSVKMCVQNERTTTAIVQTTVKICDQGGGNAKIEHGPIKINGVSYYLVPEHTIMNNNKTEEEGEEEENSFGIIDNSHNNDEGIGDSMEVSPNALGTSDADLNENFDSFLITYDE